MRHKTPNAKEAPFHVIFCLFAIIVVERIHSLVSEKKYIFWCPSSEHNVDANVHTNIMKYSLNNVSTPDGPGCFGDSSMGRSIF